jgi:predicted Zn finger-like uncharacterized protein
MPTTLACPECGSKLRVPDDLAGQPVRCARCSATFTAPAAAPPPPSPARQERPRGPDAGPPPAPPPAGPGEDLALRLNLSLDDDRPPAARPPAPRHAPEPEREPPPPARRPLLNDDADDLKDCPRCGKQLHRDYVRCPYCGARQRPPRVPRPYFGRRDAEPHRGGLVMALGIIGVVGLVCPPVGTIFGIIAWALGRSDLGKMRRGDMDPEGEGLTQAGWVCGIVAAALGLLLSLSCGAIMALGEAASQAPPPRRGW